jgi:hypothetical protein
MKTKFKDLPNWQFNIDEISPSVYKVSGIDNQKRNVEALGINPDELMEQCKKKAVEITASLQYSKKELSHGLDNMPISLSS